MSLQNLLALNFLVPFVANKLDFSTAIRGLRGMPRKLLLCGYAAGGVGTLNTIYTVGSVARALELFGEGSMLVAMYRAALANSGAGLQIDCLPLYQPTGANPTSLVEVVNSAGETATFTVAGTCTLYIGGVRVAVPVTTADTQASVALKLKNAIRANGALPVTAIMGTNPNQVLITCRWKGTTGHQIDLRATYYTDEALPVGLSLTIPAMSGGTGTDNASAIVAVMQGYRATEIVTPFTDSSNMAVLETEMATRWAENNMQDGAVVCAYRGNETACTTWLAARLSPHVHSVMTFVDATSPWETAAMAGAQVESQASVDPAVPMTGVELVGYMGPAAGWQWTVQQQQNLLAAGGCPLSWAQGGKGYLTRMVTNYTTTLVGANDRSMSELAWLKTMSYKRWYTVTEFRTKYQGYKLAQYLDPAQLVGQKVMTPELGEEIMLGIYKLFMDAGLCQNLAYYQDTLQVEVDAPNGKLKIQDNPVLVTQHYQTEITSYVVAGQV